MNVWSISALKSQAGATPMLATIHAQVQACNERTTKNNKPYLELNLVDSTGHFSLKIWSDSPVYQQVQALDDAAVLQLSAHWTQSGYGLEARDLEIRLLDEAGLADFFAGDATLRAKQDADFETIRGLCGGIGDPRLRGLCDWFFDHHGTHFRRTAAARRNHHARRGGLVEHVAQMMRSADVLCGVYTTLNRDLMLAGVLFHDCGKLWENSYPEKGFTQPVNLYGEMMGHIPLGIELVNRLWGELMASPAAQEWETLEPPSNEVRLHLLHLIGSHHGEHEFGSPVLPRTPEA
ncbi:MAG: HD domain-containing protein, partial [Luteolibacter sp.]